MHIHEVAQAILEIRRLPSPFIRSGELAQLIGPDGFQEALARRWLIQDHQQGTLVVTNIVATVEDIQRVAETYAEADEPAVGDSVIVADDGKSYEATVQAKEGGGYKLSFPPGKAPLRSLPAYKKEQLKRFAKPDAVVPKGSSPVTAQGSSFPAIGAPGIGR